jgi:hypothetical protein
VSETEAPKAMPVADRFTRERLTLEQLRAMPRGTVLLLSTVWSNFQSLQPVTLHEVSDGGAVYYVSLVPGHPTWPGWVNAHEGRFYVATA